MAIPDKYPILEYDPGRHPVIDPHKVIKPIEIPECCVLTFFQDELQKLHQNKKLHIIKKLRSEMSSHLVYRMVAGQSDIALFNPGVGAPLASALFEEIIALGCRKFIICGGAGVLDSSITMGELMVPVSAVRDEGTSYHYLPPAREVGASAKAVQAIKDTLAARNKAFRMTKTWTTDAIYRETPAKIQLRRGEGCACVEMEAAALFAVAAYRKVDIGMILYAGDDIGGEKWQSRGWQNSPELRNQLLELAVQACQEM